MRNLIGRTLGHYRIVEKIGAGGMGVVYRAHDERLDRDVAIKVLPESVAADPDRQRRFEREAKAVATLSHPNILEIHDFDTEGDVTYTVTELLEGETLREYLQTSRGPLAWRQVQEIGAAVANGLGAAHGKGVVHRDIKPSNIFLCSDGRVKILDFGLAATHEAVDSEAETGSLEAPLTRKGSVMGTAGYMSPEQVRGQPADRRSDIFSLGCVLYEMATGCRAFERGTGADTMAAILTEEPDELTASGAEVPLDLERAIQRCLEKRPEARFQSATDLAYVLRASATDTDAERVVRAVPPRKPRARWLVPAAAAALAVIAIGLWVVLGGDPGPAPAHIPDFVANRIVVAEFENRIGDPSFDDFGVHVADSITNLLRQVGRLTVATNPFRSGSQAPTRSGESAGGDPLRRLAEVTRSGLVVTGACYSRGDQVEIQARIVDPWQDEVRQSFDAVRALWSDPSPAVETLSQQVAGTLALHFDNVIPLGLSRPVQLAAYQEFAGANDLWGIDRTGMLSGLRRALGMEPGFHLARSYLMRWYIANAMVREAEAELELLEAQLPTMTPLDRLEVLSARAGLEGRPLEALRATREAVGLAPNSYWFLRNLGRDAIAANRPREAAEALSRIPYGWTAGGTAFASSPFFYLCFAHHMLGDYEAQLRVAAESHEHFPDRMVFYGLQAGALAVMGRFEEMDRIVEESLTVSVRGSTWGFSHTFTARELRAHGFRERSLELAERVVEWYRERPDEIHRSPFGPAGGYAAALNVAERWHEAREVAEQLAQDSPENPEYLGLLGVLEARIGRNDEARKIATGLLSSEDELSIVERSYERSYWRACISAQLGQLDEAMRLLERALSEGGRFDDEPHRDINLEPLWDYPPFQELIRPKG